MVTNQVASWNLSVLLPFRENPFLLAVCIDKKRSLGIDELFRRLEELYNKVNCLSVDILTTFTTYRALNSANVGVYRRSCGHINLENPMINQIGLSVGMRDQISCWVCN